MAPLRKVGVFAQNPIRPRHRVSDEDFGRGFSIIGTERHAGDAANAILTAAGYNFRRILAWLRILLRLILLALMVRQLGQTTLIPAS
jgi:hypothetical protein